MDKINGEFNSLGDLNEIFLISKSSGDLIKKIYLYLKSKNSKYSLQYICNRANIASPGYLHDVMSGTRLLNNKYYSSFCKLFQLNENQMIAFQTLISIDKEKDQNKRSLLQKKYKNLLKNLSSKSVSIFNKQMDIHLVLKIYTSFGLFNGRASIEELFEMFRSVESKIIQFHLDFLVEEKILVHRKGVYKVNENNLTFQLLCNNFNNIDFLKEQLNETKREVDQWFHEKDMALFSTELISVNLDQYKRALREFRTNLLEFSADLESSEADAVVSLNHQIFPIVISSKK